MANIPRHIEAFWLGFLESQSAPHDATRRFYESFRIGIEDQDADTGAAAILSRQKTATSSLLWEYESSGKALPPLGNLSVVENGQRVPICVVTTTWIDLIRFDDIDAQFAYEYGEGDRTLAGWRRMFWPYYSKACAALGREMSGDAPLICERFRVLYPVQVA
jgi:uncharacterized protein YhfF